MNQEITEDDLLDALKKGVHRASNLIALVTDYHGGPVTTEYLLTSDIAREFIERHFETEVECLNRNFINGLTASEPVTARKEFGRRLTDIALLYTMMIPLALIEVKIGVSTLRKVEQDLAKITSTIASLKPQFAAKVVGAAVFQVHVRGTSKRKSKQDLQKAANSIEQSLATDLTDYAKTNPGFLFRLEQLQEAHEGIVEVDAESELDGHSTRYHAIIIRRRTVPQSLVE